MSTSRTRLRQLGQLDLGAWVEAGMDTQLWSIQRRIMSALSVPSTPHRTTKVIVPSCNASGKTYLAGRAAAAFYDAYTPGTPCSICEANGSKSGCWGAKVITTSSNYEHLENNLWGELRQVWAQLDASGLALPGTMYAGKNLKAESGPKHFITGLSPNKAEGFQGYHAAHKLIIGDEATSLSEEMQQGIAGLLASGDSRLLLIFNPTTDDTYAALEARAPTSQVIKITAYDTPNFTGEPLPPGANLTSPRWLDELQAKGMGPGSYEWETRVLANFWSIGEDVLITAEDFDKAYAVPVIEGTRQLGVDLAPYGTDENVIAVRDGNAIISLEAFPAMRQDLFWEGPVADAVNRFAPHYLSWDGDGVGSGVYGYAEAIQRKAARTGGALTLLPFRGGVKVDTKYNNARSAWWWNLRRRFTTGTVALAIPQDHKLREQVTDIRYSITEAGDIKVETKERMKKRGKESPDRGDAVMYAFALVDELPIPSAEVHQPVADLVFDRSPEAMWKRDMDRLHRRGRPGPVDPWRRLHRGQEAWDDL